MKKRSPEPNVAARLSMMAIATVAVLVLALLGGLFHHHESASDSDGCSYCHTGVQTAVSNLARTVAVPFLDAVGSVDPAQSSEPAAVLVFSTFIPRAPPASTRPALFSGELPGPRMISEPSLPPQSIALENQQRRVL